MVPVCLAFKIFSRRSLRLWLDGVSTLSRSKEWWLSLSHGSISPSAPQHRPLIPRGGFLTQGTLQEAVAHTLNEHSPVTSRGRGTSLPVWVWQKHSGNPCTRTRARGLPQSAPDLGSEARLCLFFSSRHVLPATDGYDFFLYFIFLGLDRNSWTKSCFVIIGDIV